MGGKWTGNRRFYVGIKKPGTFARPERMKFNLIRQEFNQVQDTKKASGG